MSVDPEYTDPLDELFKDTEDDNPDDKKEEKPEDKPEDKKDDKPEDKKDGEPVKDRAPVTDLPEDKKDVITSANSASVAYNRDIRDIEDQIEANYPGKFTNADKRAILDEVENHCQGDPKELRRVLTEKMWDPVAEKLIGRKFMKGQLKDPKQVLKREGTTVGNRPTRSSERNDGVAVADKYFGGDPALKGVFTKGKANK